METFAEFAFEAAHQVPPYSGIHGHSFFVEIVLTGEPDPVFGWPCSLTDVHEHIDTLRQQLDEKYLNEIDGLAVPSLENLARWIWQRLDNAVPGIDRITVRRGTAGRGEGCTYRGRL
jgi:6-pyruvoyltetrahydropterin/6-carboxytetrahydropterin synthase